MGSPGRHSGPNAESFKLNFKKVTNRKGGKKDRETNKSPSNPDIYLSTYMICKQENTGNSLIYINEICKQT